jgi:hypothetical protein
MIGTITLSKMHVMESKLALVAGMKGTGTVNNNVCTANKVRFLLNNHHLLLLHVQRLAR